MAALVLVVRTLGPSVVTIRGAALESQLVPGDLVFARRVRSVPPRGAIVLTENPRPQPHAARIFFQNVAGRLIRRTETEKTRPNNTVPRLVAGVPGDTVLFDIDSVTVRGDDGYTRSYRLEPLDPGITSEQQRIQLETDHLFLISTAVGFPDSRIVGPVSLNEVEFVVRSILWPADRRTRL